jgi:hypothetical protein
MSMAESRDQRRALDEGKAAAGFKPQAPNWHLYSYCLSVRSESDQERIDRSLRTERATRYEASDARAVAGPHRNFNFCLDKIAPSRSARVERPIIRPKKKRTLSRTGFLSCLRWPYRLGDAPPMRTLPVSATLAGAVRTGRLGDEPPIRTLSLSATFVGICFCVVISISCSSSIGSATHHSRRARCKRNYGTWIGVKSVSKICEITLPCLLKQVIVVATRPCVR